MGNIIADKNASVVESPVVKNTGPTFGGIKLMSYPHPIFRLHPITRAHLRYHLIIRDHLHYQKTPRVKQVLQFQRKKLITVEQAVQLCSFMELGVLSLY